MTVRDLGLVSQVFDEEKLRALQGEMAIGHVRYSTTGSSRVGERPARVALGPPPGGARAQRQPDQRGRAALGAARAQGVQFRGTSDSEIIAALLSTHEADRIEDAVADVRAAARGRLLDGGDDEGRGGGVPRPGGPAAAGAREARRRATASPPRAAPSTSSAPSSLREVQPGEMVSLGAARDRDAPGGGVAAARVLRLRAHLLRAAGLDPRGQPHAGLAPQDGRDPLARGAGRGRRRDRRARLRQPGGVRATRRRRASRATTG